MNKEKPVFTSIIAKPFGLYAERCKAEHAMTTLGNDFNVLKSFDSFLAELNYSSQHITEEIILQWVSRLVGAISIARVRVFECILGKALRFASAFGFTSNMPELIIAPKEYQPYIFTEDELTSLCEAADNLTMRTTVYPWIYVEVPVLTRIFIACGTRTTETLTLKRKNIDLDAGCFIMTNTKNDRERVVPFTEPLKNLMRQYLILMGIIYKPEAYVFPGHNEGEALTAKIYGDSFRRLLAKAGINRVNTGREGRSICPYCLRHTFACRAVIRLKQKGINVDNLYPYLSTYMGHNDLYSTEEYLKFPECMVSSELETYEKKTQEIYSCRIFKDESEWY